jgi:hypothetical protein
MTEAVKIIEAVRMRNSVLVTFSDGKIATLTTAEIYALAVHPPAEPARSGEDSLD